MRGRDSLCGEELLTHTPIRPSGGVPERQPWRGSVPSFYSPRLCLRNFSPQVTSSTKTIPAHLRHGLDAPPNRVATRRNHGRSCPRPQHTTQLSNRPKLRSPQLQRQHPPRDSKGRLAKLQSKLKRNKPFPSWAWLDSENVASIKYAVSTQELVEQVDAVAKSKSRVSMPTGIQKLPQRAIGAREQCSDWYAAAKKDARELDSGGHIHFVGILRDALSKLGSESAATAPVSTSHASTKKPPAKSAGIAKLS